MPDRRKTKEGRLWNIDGIVSDSRAGNEYP